MIDTLLIPQPQSGDIIIREGMNCIHTLTNIAQRTYPQKKERPNGPLFFIENIQRNNQIISELAVCQ